MLEIPVPHDKTFHGLTGSWVHELNDKQWVVSKFKLNEPVIAYMVGYTMRTQEVWRKLIYAERLARASIRGQPDVITMRSEIPIRLWLQSNQRCHSPQA